MELLCVQAALRFNDFDIFGGFNRKREGEREGGWDTLGFLLLILVDLLWFLIFGDLRSKSFLTRLLASASSLAS